MAIFSKVIETTLIKCLKLISTIQSFLQEKKKKVNRNGFKIINIETTLQYQVKKNI